MAAYILARINVTDPKRYWEYTSRTPAVLAKLQGRKFNHHHTAALGWSFQSYHLASAR